MPCPACEGRGRRRCDACQGHGEFTGDPPLPVLPMTPSDHAYDVVRVTGTVWAHVQDALRRVPGLEGQLLGERARHIREVDRAVRRTEDLWSARMIVGYAAIATAATSLAAAVVVF